MEDVFKKLFKSAPIKEENGIYYFGGESDGDCFDEGDIASWRNGIFSRNWRKNELLENCASRRLLNEIIADNEYIVDLASGTGMGFIPSIKRNAPDFRCLATDASPLVLSEWRRYLHNEKADNIDFAQFSAFDMPFEDNSVRAYCGFIGLSSTRGGNDGYDLALSELRRTLADGGKYYAIENEWRNVPAALDLFKKLDKQPWSVFCEEQTSWRDRFVNSGFEVLYEENFEYRGLRADDNELGEAAAKYGVDIGLDYTAYIVGKANRVTLAATPSLSPAFDRFRKPD